MLFRATVQILVDVDSEAEALDAIAESLRPLIRAYADVPENTNIVDWRYTSIERPVVRDDGYGWERTE